MEHPAFQTEHLLNRNHLPVKSLRSHNTTKQDNNSKVDLMQQECNGHSDSSNKVPHKMELQLNLNSLIGDRGEDLGLYTDNNLQQNAKSNSENVDSCTIVVKNPAAKKYVKGSQANTDANQDVCKTTTPRTQESCVIRGLGDDESDYDTAKTPAGRTITEHKDQVDSISRKTGYNLDNYQDTSSSKSSKQLGSNFTDFRKMNLKDTDNSQQCFHGTLRDTSESSVLDKMDWDLQNGNADGYGSHSKLPIRKVDKFVKKKDSSLNKQSKTDRTKAKLEVARKLSKQQRDDCDPYEALKNDLKLLKKKDKKLDSQQIKQDFLQQQQTKQDLEAQFNYPHDEAVQGHSGTPRPSIDIPPGGGSGSSQYRNNTTYTVNFTAGSQQYLYNQPHPSTSKHSSTQLSSTSNAQLHGQHYGHTHQYDVANPYDPSQSTHHGHSHPYDPSQHAIGHSHSLHDQGVSNPYSQTYHHSHYTSDYTSHCDPVQEENRSSPKPERRAGKV